MRIFVFTLVLFCGACLSQTSAAQNSDGFRFAAIDIYLDSPAPVAAWQFELNDRNGLVRIVGVENGESTAFERTPYYDTEAVRLGTADRIIVADFSLADTSELPSGRIRIATLHLMITGASDPSFDLNLIIATTYDGRMIDASISLESTTGIEQ